MPFLVIDSSLPLGDDPPVNELPVVIILCNVDQHTVSREKLVIPQQIGVKAKDGDISWQAAEHPVCVLPADDRLPRMPMECCFSAPIKGLGVASRTEMERFPLAAEFPPAAGQRLSGAVFVTQVAMAVQLRSRWEMV